MKDTVDSGAVRAFEPYQSRDGVWHCRGRREQRHRGTDGRPRNTAQCGARLTQPQRFCGRCGGLVAWAGAAVYNGQVLRHLERLELA